MKFVITVIIIIVLIIIWKRTGENFTTRRDKAESIMEWFNSNPVHTYTEYKRSFHKSSNIVEYEDALRLHQNGGVTINSLEKII